MEYIDIHYKLEAGYEWGKGMDSNKISSFDAEIVGLFIAAGWQLQEPKFAGSSPTVVLGKSRLYLHPMEASGEVAAELVDAVEAILRQGKSFRLTNILKIGTLVDLSNEDYLAQLESKRAEIEAALISLCKTPRKNQYVSAPAVVERVKERYHIQRIVSHIGRSSLDVEWKYVNKVFEELKASGRFVVHPKQSYYCRAI